MTNKVKFGLRNVHYSKLTDAEGAITYDTPTRLLGGVELSLEPLGDPIQKYADDGLFFNRAVNQGYEGTLTIAMVSDEFRMTILGEIQDDNGAIVEYADASGSAFALMFEFQGDEKAIRHALFNCTASRPTVASATTEEGTETQDDELTFTASIHPYTRQVKTKTGPTMIASVYDNWYKNVYDSPVFIIATSVTVTPITNTVSVGLTTQLSAEVLPTGVSQTVVWSSIDETVATVDQQGLVTGVDAGTVTITATKNGLSDSVTVDVVA